MTLYLLGTSFFNMHRQNSMSEWYQLWNPMVFCRLYFLPWLIILIWPLHTSQKRSITYKLHYFRLWLETNEWYSFLEKKIGVVTGSSCEVPVLCLGCSDGVIFFLGEEDWSSDWFILWSASIVSCVLRWDWVWAASSDQDFGHFVSRGWQGRSCAWDLLRCHFEWPERMGAGRVFLQVCCCCCCCNVLL